MDGRDEHSGIHVAYVRSDTDRNLDADVDVVHGHVDQAARDKRRLRRCRRRSADCEQACRKQAGHELTNFHCTNPLGETFDYVSQRVSGYTAQKRGKGDL